MKGKAQRMATLLGISSKIGSELELNSLLQMVADSARQFCRAELCGLLVLSDENPHQFSGIWVSGWDKPPLHYPTGSGVFNLPMVTGRPLRVSDVPSHEASVGVPDGHPPIGPFLGVPLKVQDRTFGTLFVANLIGGPPFTEDDEELLVAFGAQAAVAIHNSRLYQQVEELAILRERERMAINLHDSVAQILFSIGMELDRLREAVPPGEHGERLAYARSLVNEGARRVRDVIGSLYERGGLPEGANLHREIQAVIEEFQSAHKLQVGLVVSGSVAGVPGTVAEVIVRAVREGLNNVRKHSGTDMAVVSLVIGDGRVVLIIQDNGRGLGEEAPGQTPDLHRFGLVAIRRQIERVGGGLELSNGEEGGGVLRVWAPLGPGAPGEGGESIGAHADSDR